MLSIESLLDVGFLTPLDEQCARALCRLTGDDEKGLAALGLAVASRFSKLGHVCVDIAQIAGNPVATGDDNEPCELCWPARDRWIEALRSSHLVARDDASCPLVLDGGGRLYLSRYWDYEQRLFDSLVHRSRRGLPEIDIQRLRKGLSRLFPEQLGLCDRQYLAALTAVIRPFALIVGGPGTGKTSTVVKLLALLLEQSEARGDGPLRIKMLAPTGKAAARLVESIRVAKHATGRGVIDCSAFIRAQIPEEASTIHRALGYQPQGEQRFRHGRANPLAANVVLVDEASMVDLSIMTLLVEAVADDARLILLGDKDQLASVECGSILGDLCADIVSKPYSSVYAGTIQRVTGESMPPHNDLLEAASPIRDSMVHLTRSYRFGEKSGVGQLARSINAEDEDAVMAVLRDESYSDVRWIALKDLDDVPGVSREELRSVNEAMLREWLPKLVHQHWGAFLNDASMPEKVAAFGAFRVLAAHRQGFTGVDTLNSMVEAVCFRRGGRRADGPWYEGRPVLVTRNDYRLEVFNGDIGLIGRDVEGGPMRAYFPRADGTLRGLSPTRLPEVDTAYAMTIHRSQGSEFDEVLVVLPMVSSSVISRELLYTAVTRAKRGVTVAASESVLRHAVATPIQRHSGLRARLTRSGG